SAGRAIPAHSSRRRRDGDANAAGPAFYDQPSAGHPLAGVLVLDVGRARRDPLNADARYYQDHLRPHPPADGVRSLYRRVKALSKGKGASKWRLLRSRDLWRQSSPQGVEGYSRLMHGDEEATMATLSARRALVAVTCSA